MDKAEQSTVAKYYNELVADFKTNEKKIMQELDDLARQAGAQKANDMGSARDSAEQIREWKEHMWSLEDLQKELKTQRYDAETGKGGLSSKDADAALLKKGLNQLTERGKTPAWILFLKEQTGFFSLLLWFGSILCFIAYGIQKDKADQSNLYLGIVLGVVVFITGVFSYSQTSKAASLMDDFKNFIPQKCQVCRDGVWESREAVNLVPGDVIKLEGGNRIPADVILYKCNELKVNNASLTGEAEEILKKANETHKNVFETPNVAFFGTSCTNGVGEGIVFKTGDDTAIGIIANLTQSAENKQTPLSHEIERFIILISAVAVILGVSFFLYGLIIVEYTPVDMLVFAIGIIVANVPEGLLATVTVSLALTAKRMAVKMVLVKNLESVETLGSTSCICSDKTGTLTQNRMTVSQIFYNRLVINAEVNMETFRKEWATEVGKGKDGNTDKVKKPEYSQQDAMFMELIKTLALSTTTFFQYQPTDGDVTNWYRKDCKARKVAQVDIPKESKDWNEAQRAAFDEAKATMIAQEKANRYMKRETKGDASETGLIRFLTPILMKEYEGPIETKKTENALEEIRSQYPVVRTVIDGDEQDCEIKFNSTIKFNMMIRSDAIDGGNKTVYLKGAPEKVLKRVSKILVKSEDGKGFVERDYTKDIEFETEAANSRFGLMGERVLAFAYSKLGSEFGSDYPFDVKGWAKWDETTLPGQYNLSKGMYPMKGLTLVGLVSLNDPPRPKVDTSVLKCRAAGVKVIMVTGDQPPTAAAIAHKVNIISDPLKEFATIKETQRPDGSYPTEDEAFDECNAIVIHGDTLAAVNNAEEALDDDEIEKGRKIMDWIRKPEVVFARTTPSQKLLIVDACQRLGHVVAVTGDGVNDSPAIKQADIGIAMGSGSDVAQNAADMLLLDDNFSSIVNGVEEGRLIFDNLKKSIAYTLSSNIPEISPFLFFMMFQIPQPLSTVLILCIDLGTDMVPAISFAYENPELDIMDRFPRNSSRDHLVNSKLISFAYLQIGMVQAAAGFFTYFYIMNDYGYKPGTLFGLAAEDGFYPNDTDIYDPVRFPDSKGNSNYNANGDGGEIIDMLTPRESGIDVRLFFTSRNSEEWQKCRWTADDDVPEFYYRSHVSQNQICYTVEALYYAQCGYLVSIVCVQWSDLLICKTRNLSISQQGMINNNANFALFFETALTVILCYVPFLNTVLGTRMIALPHFAVPSFSFFMVIIFYDETRKVFLREGMMFSKATGRIKFDGWVVRNTYY